MTTRNHTPGPWIFDAQNSGINSDPGWGLLNADGESLGITVHWDRRSSTDTAYANARLIAAAPDLLAALQRLRDAVQTAHVGSDERCNDCAVCVALKLADAALSKAAY
jgi:hypothetical protein